jgi:plastocyanin
MYKQPKLAPFGGATYCLRAPRISCLTIMFVGLTTLAGTKPATVADSTVEVTIDKFTFAPATITVEIAQSARHSTYRRSKVAGFRSKALDTDDSFSHQFDDIGEVDYFCSLHPRMIGRVIVRSRGS